MKKFIAFFALSGLISFAAIGQYAKIEGNLLYNGDGAKPLDNCRIEYEDATHTYSGYTYTDQYGYYCFNITANGTYYVWASHMDSQYEWGSVNSADAYLIALHVEDYEDLEDEYLLAADVAKVLGTVDGYDWQAVCDRFVHNIEQFDSGDWLYSTNKYEVVISTSGNVTQNIKMLCFGDVNGSWDLPD